MSFNTTTIGTAEPDATGNITVTVSSFSDVLLTTPAEGQVLRYDGTQWVNTFKAFEAMFIGDGASVDYATSTATATTSGAVVEFYASSVYNAVSQSVAPSSGWVSSITLGEGVYIVSAVVGLTFSASTGQALYRVYVDGGAVGSQGVVGYDDQDVGSQARARVTVSADTTATIDVRLTSSTSANSVAAQGTRHAERGWIEVSRI